jgi:NAD(P)-dependent dehydrogenase (short-subunit alcohol dehydrogenase family)
MINYLELFSLKGRNAVVTGGSGFLGKEIVKALSQAGAFVLNADLASPVDLDNKTQFIYFDITDIENLERKISEIEKLLSKIDIWVNCAYPRTDDWGLKVENVKFNSFRKNIDMHLNSYSLSSKYVAEIMKQYGGSIINLGSIYGQVGPDFSVYEGTDMSMPYAYSVIKAGISNVGRYLASYYGKNNVRVNTVCPGGVYENQEAAFVSNYSKKVPL